MVRLVEMIYTEEDMEELREENENLKEENDKLVEVIKKLRRINFEQEQNIEKLKEELQEWLNAV